MKTKPLKELWQLAFGDSMDFIDRFFSTAYREDHCLFLTEGTQLTAALYWLDCQYAGRKYAYIYAVATHPDHRGKGLCRRLMGKAHEILKEQGYAGALLYPADPGLRSMYGKMGYQNATGVSEFRCTAGTPLPLRKVGPEEYTLLRRTLLPQNGVLQENESIDYLASYAELYAGDGFLLTGTPYQGRFLGMELLGSRDAAPEILAALGFEEGTFRCPGTEIPFAMFLPLAENAPIPSYLGLVFD